MGKTDDLMIILGLLGLGYLIVKTPILRKTAVQYVVKPAITRGKKTVFVTSLPLLLWRGLGKNQTTRTGAGVR